MVYFDTTKSVEEPIHHTLYSQIIIHLFCLSKNKPL